MMTEHHLEFLSLKGGCRGSSESTIKNVKLWEPNAAAHFLFALSTIHCFITSSIELCGPRPTAFSSLAETIPYNESFPDIRKHVIPLCDTDTTRPLQAPDKEE